MASWVKNHDKIALTKSRQDALAILEAGLSAIETRQVMRETLEWDGATRTLCLANSQVCFANYDRVYFVAIGKCAVAAAEVAEELFGHELEGGFVLDVQSGVFSKLISRVGSHPLPSNENVAATEDIVILLEQATERDLVLVVISGGGSALLCSPYEMGCDTLSAIVNELMRAGANITELNIVRKHLSRVQGGQLAKIAYPATVIGLLFSDVVGDDVSTIASGPLTKDLSTKEEAMKILAKYNVATKCALPKCEVLETPKEDKYFERVQNIVIVNNFRALSAMRAKATSLGYQAKIETTTLTGEAATVGEKMATEPLEPKTVLLFGGETTVKSRGGLGEGGRNQELALAALAKIYDSRVILACASDGWDNGPAAGAIADQHTQNLAKTLGLDPVEALLKHDSFSFWSKTDSQIMTGKTGANVADLTLILKDL